MSQDTVIDIDRFPHDPKLPNGDVLIDLFGRIAAMSDALHDPDGLLQTILRDQDEKAVAIAAAQTKILNRILDEVLEIRSRLDTVEDAVDTHSANFTIMKHTEIQ